VCLVEEARREDTGVRLMEVGVVGREVRTPSPVVVVAAADVGFLAPTGVVVATACAGAAVGAAAGGAGNGAESLSSTDPNNRSVALPLVVVDCLLFISPSSTIAPMATGEESPASGGGGGPVGQRKVFTAEERKDEEVDICLRADILGADTRCLVSIKS
jgi:hypothetical protein